MKHATRWLSLLLAVLLALSTLTALAETQKEAPALQPGDVIRGFKVLEVYDSSLLNSTIYTFEHPCSGAKLTWVRNDDPEVAFYIGYRTPYVDETDTNHVFEHAIIAGSEKYPAKGIYFDLDNRSFSTFVNAETLPTCTGYPISSMSQDQLLKLMDVYMSCMVAPLVLTDERIFRREAIRFELDDPEGDIAVNGTVFAEDTGCLTNMDDQAQNNVLDALYPGEIASNSLGRAYEHYDDLTFEHTIETYDRCYHFDNSLIILYGDLDVDRFLGFLDGEYLSKYPAPGTDLSAWKDGITPAGFADVRCAVPAYEGDAVENASVIDYAIDLDGLSLAELYQYHLLCVLLNIQGSPLYNARLEMGIENPVSASVNLSTAKPYLSFRMTNANPDQKDSLKTLAEEALRRIASEGVNPEMMRVLVRSSERDARLTRNGANVGVNLALNMVLNWARCGELNYYRVLEQALKTMAADGQQLQLKRMALNLLMPRRSALVTNVPTPGLAEQHDQALAQYLADMKAAMSPEALKAMAEETAAFNDWNAEEQHNNGFLISPSELPDPTAPAFEKTRVDGATVYRGETSAAGVARCSVYFDLTGMSREELQYLMLSTNYLLQMDTDAHSVAELALLNGEYISELNCQLLYPNAATGENHRPMLGLSWTSLTEDFEKSLDLVLELVTRTNYRNADMLRYVTQAWAESRDLSRRNGNEIAQMAAWTNEGLRSDTQKFLMDVAGQDSYYLISDAAKRLQEDADYAGELAGHYENAVKKAFNRDNLILMVAAPGDAMDGIVDCAISRLNTLPGKTADADYALPEIPKSRAICVEDSLNNSIYTGDYMADPDFAGRYLPYAYALGDLYMVPYFRFKLGVYTAQVAHQWAQGTLIAYTVSDPNVKKTVEGLRAIPEVVKNLELTEEMLNGYILNAYGMATRPLGVINDVVNAMTFDLLGMDADRVLAIKSDIRNARLEQQAEAAEHIGSVFENASLNTVGNEALIRADADCFDEVISYRHGD